MSTSLHYLNPIYNLSYRFCCHDFAIGQSSSAELQCASECPPLFAAVFYMFGLACDPFCVHRRGRATVQLGSIHISHLKTISDRHLRHSHVWIHFCSVYIIFWQTPLLSPCGHPMCTPRNLLDLTHPLPDIWFLSSLRTTRPTKALIDSVHIVVGGPSG